ncbi:MAG: YidC/Oxa1 family membrane protein insertase [Candidatus Paceibacterota bacterium]
MWSAIKGFFSTILYEPIYNGLVFFIDIIPGGSVGLAVILITLAVKFILLPLSIKSVRTQQTMKQVKPHIDEIKEKYGDDKEKQAQKMMEAYAEHNVNPFAGILIILIQFPIIIALYYVFFNGGLPEVNMDIIYSFVQIPEMVNMTFLGTDLAERSIIFAAIAGASQYLQSWISNKLSDKKPESDEKPEEKSAKGQETFIDEFKDTIGGKLTYILPGVVFAISYSLPAVIAVYWATSNLFQALQTVYVNKVINTESATEESKKESD